MLILALAVSPVLILGGVRWSNDIAREEARRHELMMIVAEDAAVRVERVLATAPAMLDVIDTLAPYGAECGAEFAELLELFPEYSNLSLVDANGIVQCTAVPNALGVSVAHLEWFRTLRDTNAQFAQSSAYVGSISRAWLLASARKRVSANGEFAGALVVGVPLSSLVLTLDRQNLPHNAEVSLADPSGRVFASEHMDRLPNDVVRKLAQGGAVHTIRTADSPVLQAAIVPLSQGALYVMLSAPVPAPTAVENLAAFGNFALPLAAWLLALVAAWLAADLLVLRWIDYLRRIAALYASGKLNVQPLRARQKAPAEINMLADTLQEMATNIRDRTSSLEAAVEARDAAMKEIHHRVKNNLQIINSLLSLQSRKVKDPGAVAVLNDARTRINALSLIHRSLYEHTDIRSVDVRSFLGELVAHLDQALGADDQNIHFEALVDSDTIDADLAVPMALFTAEAVTNAVKHAFPGVQRGRITVSYIRRADDAELLIEDDGVGAPGENATGLGSTLMAAFARQLGGVMEEGVSPSGGRLVRVRMKRAEAPQSETVAAQ